MTEHDRPPPAIRMGTSVFRLQDGKSYLIGSGDDAAVRIGHHSVDPQHARVSRRGALIEVEDLGSSSGTWLGANRASGALALQIGQTFRVGSITIGVVAAPDLLGTVTARARHQPTFQEQMAAELRRAPWFLVSAAAHAVVLLLLAYYIRTDEPQVRTYAAATLQPPEQAEEPVEVFDEPDEQVEIEETTEQPELATPTLVSNFEPEVQLEPLPQQFESFDIPVEGFGAKVGRGGGGSGDLDGLFGLGSESLRTGGLKQTVARLRETGFEVVFVFDSTGSMQWVLDAAKERIFRMVDVLHTLVPAARIGIVTYRDRGRAEEYLIRAVPLSQDFYRVMTFMHSVDANGGTDFEEAVLEGVQAALQQKWLPKSKRVVVVLGDAPPHKEDEGRLRSAARAFTRGGSGFIHTVVTAGGVPDQTTVRTFRELAQAGSGEAVMLESQDHILEQVLSIALGQEHQRDLSEVYQIVDQRNQRADVEALDEVKRGDLAKVQRALRRRPVNDEYVRAIVKLANPDVTRWMIEQLADASLPEHTRHAMSYCVMRCLRLPHPPIDPEHGTPLNAAAKRRLLQRLEERRR